MKPVYRICVTAFSLCALAFSANAADSKDKKSQNQGMSIMQMKESQTLNKLHHINQNEIQLMKMAQSKAQSSQLKQMIQSMMQEHNTADQRVESVAKSKNVKLYSYSPSTSDKATMDALKKLEGPQFDQAFMESQRMEHKMAMQELQLAQESTQDPEIKSAIQSMIPTIKQHMDRASSSSMSPSAGGEQAPENSSKTQSKSKSQ